MSQPIPARGRRSFGRAAIAAVILVPLAFAGLFVASLAGADTALDRIPAAVVNSDELVNQPQPDGTTTPVFAGRALVTELTGAGDAGFDWTITNAAAAKELLASGEVYAVLTVPKNFSASILSLQSDSPVRANIQIRTDDSHSYLAGTVVEAVGSSLTGAFGAEITSQFISGIYSSIGGIGDSLGTAASGATDLAGGATDLGTGLGTLAAGVASTQSGAASLASGLTTYTGGVSSLSGGLNELSAGAGQLSGISEGVGSYTSGVSQLAAGIAQATAGLDDPDPEVVATARATLDALSAQLTGAAGSGATLANETAGGIQGIQSGIAQSARGASRLSAGGASLASGANGIADGLGSLASGAAEAGTGATALATGATALAEGLEAGAGQVPALSAAQGGVAADVVASPISLTVDRNNEVSDIGQIIATFLVPFGLWVGALATFLVLRPVTRPALGSSARGGRLVGAVLVRASGVGLLQAALLTALLHLGVGLSWGLLPAAFGFALLMALAFTAFHYLLTVGLGRRGLIVSLFLFALQVTATGGLYPTELLAAPIRVLSPFLPLTYGVSGMQSIVAGANPADVVIGSLVLVALGVLSLLASLVVIGRVRRTTTLRLMAVAG